MSGFDKNLLHSSEIMDTLFKPFGTYAPKKRMLQVDYKENGVDKNISLVVYQNVGTTDKQIIAELVRVYTEDHKEVYSIVEINEKMQVIGVLYASQEMLEKMFRLWKKGNRR